MVDLSSTGNLVEKMSFSVIYKPYCLVRGEVLKLTFPLDGELPENRMCSVFHGHPPGQAYNQCLGCVQKVFSENELFIEQEG